jgi:hypothetical protein
LHWSICLITRLIHLVFHIQGVEENIWPKKDEVTGVWRKLHNEELHDMYSSPTVVWMMKSRRMRWVGHVAHMGDGRGVCGVLMRKPEGKRPMGRPSCRWECNIKMDLKWDVGVWTGSSWLRIETYGGHL